MTLTGPVKRQQTNRISATEGRAIVNYFGYFKFVPWTCSSGLNPRQAAAIGGRGVLPPRTRRQETRRRYPTGTLGD